MALEKSKNFQLYTMGATFDEGISYAKWEEFGKTLFTFSGAMLWYVGDWLNFGEHKFGEKYSQALDVTRYDYGTLRNAAYVSGRYAICDRHSNLSWRHHADCARFELADRTVILNMAEQQGMTSNQLRDFLHKQYPTAYKQLPQASDATFPGWWTVYKKRVPPELVQHPDIEHVMLDCWNQAQKVIDKSS